MNQLEMNAHHRQNPASNDYWFDAEAESGLALVLDVLESGNVIITTDINHEKRGWEFDYTRAYEVTLEEFQELVKSPYARVHIAIKHYLVHTWSQAGKPYKDRVPPHVDVRITGRYIDLLKKRGHIPMQDPSGSVLEGNHLLWMLFQIRNGALSSQTKAHRWLGFVQCALCVLRIVELREERDFTRDIFNGE